MKASVFTTPWPRDLSQYGASDTYARAGAWLKDCPTVADWGGAAGWMKSYLPETCAYTCVDGTVTGSDKVMADLRTYHEPSDGILLRHVLDNTHEWLQILQNALGAFRQRLVVVTFTPSAPVTHRIERKNGWPTWEFNRDDLRNVMGDLLVLDEDVQTTHPERVYYLERR